MLIQKINVVTFLEYLRKLKDGSLWARLSSSLGLSIIQLIATWVILYTPTC